MGGKMPWSFISREDSADRGLAVRAHGQAATTFRKMIASV